MKLRYILPLVIFGALVALFAVGLKLNPRDVPSPLIGRSAPAFAQPSLRDEKQTLTDAIFKEQPVSLFNVWASWCTSCREEHEFLLALSKRGELPIYGLNWKDTRPDATSWLARFGNPYRLIVADPDNHVGLDWGVYGVPETYVVDGRGVIRFKYTGPLTADAWTAQVKPVVDRILAEARK